MLTKHLADKEIEKEIKDNNLKATILYPGLMLGPGDYTNTAKLIKAIKDKRMPVNMPGGTNLIDVRDVSKGIINTLKQTNKEHYLLSGHNLTMKEITKTIANEVSVNPPKLTVPKLLNPLLFNLVLLIESLARNKTEVTADNVDSSFKFRYFDNTKAKKELKWEPEISFQKTIKDSVDWMNKNDLFKE